MFARIYPQVQCWVPHLQNLRNPRKVAVLDDVIVNNITFFSMTPVTAKTIATSELEVEEMNI